MSYPLAARLQQGLTELNLMATPEQTRQWVELLTLLKQWNRYFNLTALHSDEDLLVKHLFDSLSIAPYLHGQQLLDVGTGAGFPGLPLAILYPTQQWTLLDSNGKKIRFITQVKIALGLTNVTEVQARVENWQRMPLFDQVVTRAFSDIPTTLQQTRHLLAPGGEWLLLKSKQVTAELATLPEAWVQHPLTVPGLAAERYLIVIPQST